jgi:nicotinate-nucleotide adenylyltransferase
VTAGKRGILLGVGIMGGTFNPVHHGHLRAAEEVAESLELTKVIFVPSAIPPHKSGGELVPFEHRWRMLQLAVAENPRFSLSDLEHQRPGKSYSVETLTQLSGFYGGKEELYFLLGLDAFLELPTWKDYRTLFSLCHFVVVARSGYLPVSLHTMLQTKISKQYSFDDTIQAFVHPKHYSIYYREVTLLDISSSEIRQLLVQGRSVRYLVPREVEAYIRQEGLYRYH